MLKRFLFPVKPDGTFISVIYTKHILFYAKQNCDTYTKKSDHH